MKRKLILILLTALLAVGMVGVSAPAARADDTVYTEGTLYYTIANESITITGCFGRDAEIHVPAMIAGIPVNTIASGAFANNENVKKVYLPDTISKVEPGAFGSWVKVIYNANTDHPQDTPTDLILGLLPPAATDVPEVTEAPDPTQAAQTQAPQGGGSTPVTGSGTAELGDQTTPKPTAKATAKATAVPATPEPTQSGTIITEVEVDLFPSEAPTDAPTEAPTEVPVTEAPKATDAPKAVEAKATNAPVKTEPTAAPEPAPAEQGKGRGWIWGVAGAAALAAVGAVALRKKKK